MSDEPERRTPVIGVVGPCGAGKSTLVRALRRLGWQARHIAQEHSHVPDMWARLVRPDVLVFLDASFETCTRRRRLHWREEDYREQQRRLAHARRHAHVYIPTDHLTPDEVLQQVLTWLQRQGWATPDGRPRAAPSASRPNG